MELKDKIKQYFKLTDEQKDEVLVEIINVYRDMVVEHKGMFNTKMLIDMDIKLYTQQEEFELVQALTDIRTAINQLEEEIRKTNEL